MLPQSVLERLAPAEIERIERRAGDASSRFARDLRAVLENARRTGASSEHIALAVGVALSLAESQAEPNRP